MIDKHQNRQEMNEADQLALAMVNTSDYMLRLKCLIYKSEFDGRDGKYFCHFIESLSKNRNFA